MKVVDARGHHCPVPTLRLRKALEAATAGDLVQLLADDPMARVDVPHFCGEAGYELVAQSADGDVLCFTVRKPGSSSRPAADVSPDGQG